MKFKAAYTSYLLGSTRLEDLQAPAQQDIENLKIGSDLFFYFAYILDKHDDDTALFKHYLEKIVGEFNLPPTKNALHKVDIISFIISEIEKLKIGPRDNLLLRLKKIAESISQAPSKILTELAPYRQRSSTHKLDTFHAVLLHIYKKPITVCQIMSIFADYEYEILETEEEYKKAIGKLDPLIKQLNPTAAKLAVIC